MPGGVIFDMDGVLVDSGEPHHRSWQMLAEKHGQQVSEERFRQSFGKRSADIIRSIWGDEVSDAEVRAYDAEKEALYREIIRGNVPLMPGCREVLAALKAAGYMLAVGTSGPPENLELVLADGAIGEFFTATVHGFDIAHGKPAPDCFLLAAQRIDVAPERCVVIEDAPVGVEAARAAGMQAVGLTGTHPGAPLRAAGATRIIEDLRSLTPALVAELGG